MIYLYAHTANGDCSGSIFFTPISQPNQRAADFRNNQAKRAWESRQQVPPPSSFFLFRLLITINN